MQYIIDRFTFMLQILIQRTISLGYRQYCVLVDYKDAEHTESDSVTVQTTQKYIYLHICTLLKLVLDRTINYKR